jgi:hypothetical protein
MIGRSDVRDTPSLWLARTAIREAYTKVRRLPQRDPGIRETATRLDEMAVELSREISDAEPELEMRV